MSRSEHAPPDWDMSVVYPSLAPAEFEEGFRSTVQVIQQLETLLKTCEEMRRLWHGDLEARSLIC